MRAAAYSSFGSHSVVNCAGSFESPLHCPTVKALLFCEGVIVLGYGVRRVCSRASLLVKWCLASMWCDWVVFAVVVLPVTGVGRRRLWMCWHAM